MHASSLLRLHSDEKLNREKQDSIVLNSSLTSSNTIKEMPTKSYVGILRESSRDRRDVSSAYNDQDNEFDNIKKTN